MTSWQCRTQEVVLPAAAAVIGRSLGALQPACAELDARDGA
jgi:hypothetical protein